MKMKRYLLLAIATISILLFSIGIYAKGYGVGPCSDGKRPNCEDPIITKNNGYCIGKDEKVVYLTFDCGYENGYTNAILDTLSANDVKAIFFITGHYLNTSEAIVRRMVEEGHIVGNHSYSHRSFTKLSSNEIISDCKKLEDLYYQKIGIEMSKYIRPPKGEYDNNSQTALANNGYKSIFWSLAYVDWNKDLFYGNEYSYKKVMNKMHNGAIILMHTVSKDNMTDLDKIIKKLKNDGYEFMSVDTL